LRESSGGSLELLDQELLLFGILESSKCDSWRFVFDGKMEYCSVMEKEILV